MESHYLELETDVDFNYQTEATESAAWYEIEVSKLEICGAVIDYNELPEALKTAILVKINDGLIGDYGEPKRCAV